MRTTPKAAKNQALTAIQNNRKFTIEDIWAELQQLRTELGESKQREARLEAKVEELEKENARLRQAQWKSEEFLRGQIRKLENDVAQRDRKLDKANKQLAWFRKTFFDRTSEAGQPSDEAEQAEGEAPPKEKKAPSKRPRGQQKGSKGHGPQDRSDVPAVETITLEIPGGCSCPDCGLPYLVLPVTQDCRLIDIAIDVFQTIYQRLKYVSQCQCQGKKIVVAPPPPKLYPKTAIGNSLWVHLVVQKFLFGMPTNRTLKDLSLRGFSLAEGTVAGGLQIIDEMLIPLFEAIKNRCRGADLWNADETTWRVFDSDKTRWWLWVVASSDAVVYILDPSRSKKVPNDFFAGSQGVLMTDRLASYKSLQEAIRKAWCWVHVRRDFLNIFNGIEKLEPWAKEWLEAIAILFVLADRRFKLWQQGKSYGAVWDNAQQELNEHVAKLRKRWEEQLRQSKELHEEQKRALLSLKRHWEGLTIFLEDPRIPLHNNRAERLLRNAVIVRKGSFGSGSEWAGNLAAKLFSIFQTWLINGLDPQALLHDYFDLCSTTPGRAPPDVGEFLPWQMSEDRKRSFALPKSYKRPG